ncbi:PDR/VanB family oxidoreductase [Mycolicibacterium goodii]|uniref:PDR/VanB family oxidoreductase n=1 Tax=Mycolicibacterium goodii TaxID=134601 RepID=A0ABS6HXA9_MYCGD|nr:PDR/VanB family oxidoreductase [Mycolicibacterium goodii]MBU8827312.1 PDR/VanB family oxidoreductase [Mycolicibacterium goodii]MBU8840990.1 PDR/VanB family oxidoreductase [Mycolicibacterium goodii]
MKLHVTQLRLEAAGVISVTLRSPDGDRLPAWAAGAHVALTLPSGRVRQYSLCGAPDDPYSYTVAVLHVTDGRGGSREIHENLRIGQILEVGEPQNNFELVEARQYLFIAGGIGITPILAMMDSLRAAGDPAPFRLIYGGRTIASMALLDRLSGFDDVEVLPEDTAGVPNLAAAFAACPAGTRVYCCGPAPMLDAARVAAAEYPGLTLHTERFSAGVRESTDGAFEVELVRTGVTVTVSKDMSVLDAVLAVAPDTPFSCTAGFCGTCETKVLAGEVDHRDDLLTNDEREANATMMICVSRSKTCGKLALDL